MKKNWARNDGTCKKLMIMATADKLKRWSPAEYACSSAHFKWPGAAIKGCRSRLKYGIMGGIKLTPSTILFASAKPVIERL